MEFGYVDWNSFIWGIIIAVGVIQGYRHRNKIFDFNDEEIKEEISHKDKNYQEDYKKGA